MFKIKLINYQLKLINKILVITIVVGKIVIMILIIIAIEHLERIVIIII